MKAAWFLFVLIGWPLQGLAHALAPALLDLHDLGGGRYEVAWRTSVTSVQRVDVAPRFVERCARTSEVVARVEEGEALASRWTMDCGAAGLAGTTVEITGLQGSGINVIVRYPGTERLLDGQERTFTFPVQREARGPLAGYFALGVEHLATGFDHLLFVLGLVMLVRRLRPLALTVTAFTLGHSLTLALATLGLMQVDPRLAELGIALTLLWLGVEVLRPEPGWLGRRPGVMAASFGLVHGLGFAGALREVGLPDDSIPVALLGFNLGIESGQLLVVAGLVAAGAVLRRVGTIDSWRWAPAYAIGSLAALWCYERLGYFFI